MQMADVLVCRPKTFSHVQIFALDWNKRKATIPLCTMDLSDCGTPQHLKCKRLIYFGLFHVLHVFLPKADMEKFPTAEVSSTGPAKPLVCFLLFLPLAKWMHRSTVWVRWKPEVLWQFKSPKTLIRRGWIFILPPENLQTLESISLYLFLAVWRAHAIHHVSSCVATGCCKVIDPLVTKSGSTLADCLGGIGYLLIPSE